LTARLIAAIARLSDVRSRFGLSAACRTIAARIGSRLCGLVVTQVVWLDVGEALATAASAPGFCFRELTPAEIVQYARDPGNDLDPQFAQRAEDGRNICFAALDGARLAAYGWYAREGIEAEHCFGFALRLPHDVAYMYKGFTHPDYRGQRLHGIAMGLALQHLSRQEGIRALVSTVEWTNEASLRSCTRLGYRRLGQLVRFRFAGRDWRLTARALRGHGIGVVRPGRAARTTMV
jgi:ribosomal protein S18 acetylase RimI-like enzyme